MVPRDLDFRAQIFVRVLPNSFRPKSPGLLSDSPTLLGLSPWVGGTLWDVNLTTHFHVQPEEGHAIA
jgi:hypothetical protein